MLIQKEIEKYRQIDIMFCTQMNHLLYPRLYIVHFYKVNGSIDVVTLSWWSILTFDPENNVHLSV